MSNKFVDLALGNVGDGSELNPFGWDSFISDPESVGGDVYHFVGSKSYTASGESNVYINKPNSTITKWQANQPWSITANISDDSFLIFNLVEFEGGYIDVVASLSSGFDAQNSLSLSLTLKNMVIKTNLDQAVSFSNTDVDIFGSIIIGPVAIRTNNVPNLSVTDSILMSTSTTNPIITQGSLDPATVTLNNNYLANAYSKLDSESHYLWDHITFVEANNVWDQAFIAIPTGLNTVDWDYDTLFGSIPTPPQPGIGSPDYVGYETDLWGNARSGIGTGFMEAIVIDTVEPEWILGYPNIETVTATTAQISVQINEDGTGYYVVLPNGEPAPSALQIKSGLDSTDSLVAMSGNVVLVPNTEALINLSGLTSETQYDIYIVVEDTANNLQTTVTQLDIDTLDVTAPDWVVSYPSLDEVTINTAKVLVNLIEDGMVYGVALPKGSVAPAAIQIRNGTDSNDVVIGDGLASSVAVVGNAEFVLSFSSLMINKDYEVHIVGEDTSNNLMASAIKLGFTTLPLIRGQKSLPSVEIGQIITININSLDVITSKSFPEIFKMAIFPGNGYDIIHLGEKSFDLKISGNFDNMTREVLVKVGDGIVVSDEFKYKLQVVKASRSKEKPISYGVALATPDPFTPPFRRV